MSIGIAGELVKLATEEERERCAKLVENFPSRMLVLVPRPGGPPGNYYRETTREDIAEAIRRADEESKL